MSVQSRERKALLDDGGWTDFADNFEVSDDQEEMAYLPAAFWLNAFDWPSLVPMTARFVARGGENRTLRTSLSPPLRC